MAGGGEVDPMLMVEVTKVGRAVEEADEMILVGLLVELLALEEVKEEIVMMSSSG